MLSQYAKVALNSRERYAMVGISLSKVQNTKCEVRERPQPNARGSRADAATQPPRMEPAWIGWATTDNRQHSTAHTAEGRGHDGPTQPLFFWWSGREGCDYEGESVCCGGVGGERVGQGDITSLHLHLPFPQFSFAPCTRKILAMPLHFGHWKIDTPNAKKKQTSDRLFF